MGGEGEKQHRIQFLKADTTPTPDWLVSIPITITLLRGAQSLAGSEKKHLLQQFENHDSRGVPTINQSETGGSAPRYRAVRRAPAAQGRGPRRSARRPPPSRRDAPRILTSQPAAAASITRMPLPPLQDEVGVGPLGDPQRVGQQHLLWVHPHIPGRRGRTHNGAAGRLLHTPTRTGALSRTRSRPHPGGKRLQQRAARGAPATTKPPRAAGEDGEDAGTVSSILPARRRRRLPRARGRRRPGLPPAARPRPRAAGGAGGGGSGVAKSRAPGSGSAVDPGCGLHELLRPRGVGRAGLGCGCSRGADHRTPGRLGLEQLRALEAPAR